MLTLEAIADLICGTDADVSVACDAIEEKHGLARVAAKIRNDHKASRKWWAGFIRERRRFSFGSLVDESSPYHEWNKYLDAIEGAD